MQLLTVDPAKPIIFDNKVDLAGHFKGLPQGSTHNVVVNEESEMAYSVGAVPRNGKCRAGIIFINMTNPALPTSPGCASEDGYVHDAQCLVYRGPDTKYVGREICYGYNEDTLTMYVYLNNFGGPPSSTNKFYSYDVTNKVKPTIISKTSYQGATYTHQGWVLDKNNQEWLLLDDEYDEVEAEAPAADGRPVTYIWNIKNLAKPTQTGYYKGSVVSIDHNQYIHEGKAFQSNYGSGFRILNVSSIPQDPTGKGVKEIGFFDVYPEDDYETGGGLTRFVGSWSSYALFKSGFIFVNTIERGGYVLKYSPRADSVAPPGTKLGPRPAGWKPASQQPALGQPAAAKGTGTPLSWPRTGGDDASEDDDE
jgi:hypothetical protein